MCSEQVNDKEAKQIPHGGRNRYRPSTAGELTLTRRSCLERESCFGVGARFGDEVTLLISGEMGFSGVTATRLRRAEQAAGMQSWRQAYARWLLAAGKRAFGWGLVAEHTANRNRHTGC